MSDAKRALLILNIVFLFQDTSVPDPIPPDPRVFVSPGSFIIKQK